MRKLSFLNFFPLQFYILPFVRFGDLAIVIYVLLKNKTFKISLLQKRNIFLTPILFSCLVPFFLVGKEINLKDYIFKYFAIILFFACFIAGQSVDKKYIERICCNFINIAVFFSILICIFGNFLPVEAQYYFGWDFERHVNFGLIRSGPFQEGNYFGAFIALYSLFLRGKIQYLLISFIGVLISASPIPIIIIMLLLIKEVFRKITVAKLIFLSALLILISLIFVNTNLLHSPINKIKAAEDSPENRKGTFLERKEFMLSGFRMFFQNPIFGVGPGQFGSKLGDYTDYEHLKFYVSQGKRYITNNVYAELLAEYGLFGAYTFVIIILFFIFNTDFKFLTLVLLLLTYVTFPTFFLPWNGFFLGLLTKQQDKNTN